MIYWKNTQHETLSCVILELVFAGSVFGRKEAEILIRLKKVLLRRWLSGKEPTHQCRRCRLDLRIGKDPLEKEMATHSSILAWKIQWTEKPVELQSGLQESLDMINATKC